MSKRAALFGALILCGFPISGQEIIQFQSSRYVDVKPLTFGLSAETTRLENEERRLKAVKANLDEWKGRIDRYRADLDNRIAARKRRSEAMEDADQRLDRWKENWRCPKGFSIDECSEPAHKLEYHDYVVTRRGEIADEARRIASLAKSQNREMAGLDEKENSYNAQINTYYEDFGRYQKDRTALGDKIVAAQRTQSGYAKKQKEGLKAYIKPFEIKILKPKYINND